MWESLTVHGRQYNSAHARCMLRNQGYRHTLRICNTYCLSTVTVVILYVYCLSRHHINAISVCLYPLMDLIRVNSRTALVKGDNDHVLRSYTFISLLSVGAIDYYINRNLPGALPHAKQHCTAVHTLYSYSRQTSPWRGFRERL
jgi:hypothetical protein